MLGARGRGWAGRLAPAAEGGGVGLGVGGRTVLPSGGRAWTPYRMPWRASLTSLTRRSVCLSSAMRSLPRRAAITPCSVARTRCGRARIRWRRARIQVWPRVHGGSGPAQGPLASRGAYPHAHPTHARSFAHARATHPRPVLRARTCTPPTPGPSCTRTPPTPGPSRTCTPRARAPGWGRGGP